MRWTSPDTLIPAAAPTPVLVPVPAPPEPVAPTAPPAGLPQNMPVHGGGGGSVLESWPELEHPNTTAASTAPPHRLSKLMPTGYGPRRAVANFAGRAASMPRRARILA